jgi:hypothetical protein
MKAMPYAQLLNLDVARSERWFRCERARLTPTCRIEKLVPETSPAYQPPQPVIFPSAEQ